MNNPEITYNPTEQISKLFQAVDMVDLNRLDFEASAEELSSMSDIDRSIITTVRSIREDIQKIQDKTIVKEYIDQLYLQNPQKGAWLKKVLAFDFDLNEENEKIQLKQSFESLETALSEASVLSDEERASVQDIFHKLYQDIETYTFSSDQDVLALKSQYENALRMAFDQEKVSSYAHQKNDQVLLDFLYPSVPERTPEGQGQTRSLESLMAHHRFPAEARDRILGAALVVSDPLEQKNIVAQGISEFCIQEWRAISQVTSEQFAAEVSQIDQTPAAPNAEMQKGFMNFGSGALSGMMGLMQQNNDSFVDQYEQSPISMVMPLSEVYAIAKIDQSTSHAETLKRILDSTSLIESRFSQKAVQMASLPIDLPALSEKTRSLEDANLEDMNFLVKKLNTMTPEYFETKYEQEYTQYVREKGRLSKDFDEWISLQEMSPWERLSFIIQKFILLFKGLNPENKDKKVSDELENAKSLVEGLKESGEVSGVSAQKRDILLQYNQILTDPNIRVVIKNAVLDIESLTDNPQDQAVLRALPSVFSLAKTNATWKGIVAKNLSVRALGTLYHLEQKGKMNVNGANLEITQDDGSVRVVALFADDVWQSELIEQINSSI